MPIHALHRLLYRSALSLCCVLSLQSCNNLIDAGSLQSGDLLFQVCPSSQFSEAILKATSREAGLEFSHVGIFTVLDGDSVVIEASSQRGVTITPLESFIAESRHKASGQSVVAMRVTAQISVADAVTRALNKVGKEYDWEFDTENDRYYCSELVQACYLHADGSPLFGSVPMNFLDHSGNMPDFWSNLFARLGKPIPQGSPGTNPNSIYTSPCLIRVKSYK